MSALVITTSMCTIYLLKTKGNPYNTWNFISQQVFILLFSSYRYIQFIHQGSNHLGMDGSDFIIGKRTLVGTVANTNSNALEPFLNPGSTIQIEDLDLLYFPGLDPIHAGDNPFCLHVIRSEHGNIPGAVGKAGRRTDGALLM